MTGRHQAEGTPNPGRTRRAGSIGAVGLLRRHLATDRASAALLAAGVALVTAVLVLAPRMGDAVVAADLADQLTSVGVAQRDPSIQRTWLPGDGTTEARRNDTRTGEQVLTDLAAELTTARDDAGPGVRPALGEPRVVLTRERTPVDKGPRADDIHAMTLALRADLALPELTTVAEGRLPEPYPQEVVRAAVADPATLQDAPVLEVALAGETAERMRWEVGERRTLDDLAVPLRVELVGVLEARDADHPDWAHLPSTLVPYVVEDGNIGTTIHGTGYVDPAAVPVLLIPTGLVADAWIPLDVTTLAAADRAVVLPELRSLLADLRATSELTRVLPRTAERSTTTAAYVGVLTVGPVGAALGLVAMTGALAATRRRRTVEVARARGAGAGSLAGAFGVQVAVVTVPAALLATLAAALASPWVTGAVGAAGPASAGGGTSTSSSTSTAAGHGAAAAWAGLPDLRTLVLAVGVGLVPALLTAASVVVAARSTPGSDGRSTERGPGRGAVVAGAVVVLLTGAAVVALALGGVSAAGGDVLVLAAPVLVGVSAALLTALLLPPVLRALSRRLRATRGLPHLLGSALAARTPAGGLTAVVVLVLAVTMVTFSALTWATVRSGIATTSAGLTGADVRLSGGLTATDLRAAQAVPGVAATTVVREVDGWSLEVGRATSRAVVVVVESEGLGTVQRDLPIPVLPELTGGPGLRVLVSPETDAEGSPTRLSRPDGESFEVQPVHVPRVAGVTSGTSWVVVDAEAWATATDEDPEAGTITTVLVDLAPGDDDALARLRAAVPAGVEVTTPDDVGAGLRRAPLVRGIETALLAATLLSAAFAAGTVLLAGAAGRPARRRLLGLLHVLGAPRRTERSLLAWELGPVLVASLLAGAAAGTGLAWVVQRAADLRLLTGGDTPPTLTLDPTAGAVVGVVLVLPVLGAALASRLLTTAAARRSGGATTLREGEDL